MYSQYEKPIIKCSIYYYDIKYNVETSKQVLDVLEKYDMFPPEKFYAGKFTKNRFIFTNEKTKEILIQAYSEKDILGIDMASGNSRKVDEYWRVDWNYTFYKNSKLPVEPAFMPWNIISIHSTYGRLKDPKIYVNFMNCIKELIAILNPFYASIDDIANKVKLMDKTKEKHFVPSYIQNVYWGNYFGEEHCQKFGDVKMNNIPVKNIEKINGGVLFTLSDSVLDFNSFECMKSRSKVSKHLGI